MTWPIGGVCTGVGSLSLTDPWEAVHYVLDEFPELPWWPQLPNLATIQETCIGNLPGLIEVGGKYQLPWSGVSLVSGLKRHYQSKRRPDPLKAEPSYKIFLKEMESLSFMPGQMFKGQLFGPLTLINFFLDENRELLTSSAEVFEIFAEHVEELCLRHAADIYKRGGEALIVLDEPLFQLNNKNIAQLYREFIQRLKPHMRVGAHVCGSSDWNALFNLDFDYVNLDVWTYLDDFVSSKIDISEFVEKGNVLGLGIVPTSNSQDQINLIDVETKLSDVLVFFSQKLDQLDLEKQVILTPSCGTGCLAHDQEREVYSFLKKVLRVIR